jgi:hypothetical protein
VPVADPNGVFVTSQGTGSACTQSSPCGSISTAAGVAASSGKTTVYVEQGTYNEQVVLQGGSGTITIDGGWTISNGTWTLCNATGSSIVVSSLDRAVVVGSGSWKLENFSIVNNTSAAAGQTLYGVFATGGSLTVSGGVTVAQGGDGTPAPPTTGTGVNGNPGGCTSDTGANGGATNPGQAGSAAYTASGYAQTAALAGATGQNGHDGTATQGQCGQSCDSCTWSTVDATCNCDSTLSVCAYGTGGCAGKGGPGGAPGGSGGSSIGIFAWGATVSVQGTVSAGRGGNGQNGATGNAGGSGAAGVAGSACTQNCGKKSVVVCQSPCNVTLTAGAGGTGGNGGQGGQGGGGSGGDSYCYYQGTGAAVTTGGCSTAQASTAGNGAASGNVGHYP